MQSPQIFSALAAFAMLFSGTQIVVHAQTAPTTLSPAQTTKMPVKALPIKDFKLLTSGAGWVSTGNRLLRTTDGGTTWKDISPPNPNGDQYASAFFLNADTGWVLLSGHPRAGECADNDQSESDWAFHIASTVDGGKSWSETHVKTPSCDSGSFSASLNDGGSFTFSDQRHGWLSLQYQSGSAFSFGILLATSDGGQT